ncbi:hypothetical protein [Gorillibacterium sp. sgz500922]|uniref:hypothetical protein n=1 Tax=Gorillibacterium sp. sgz500922 TaxID=3446694 RepID=UPI003F678D30
MLAPVLAAFEEAGEAPVEGLPAAEARGDVLSAGSGLAEAAGLAEGLEFVAVEGTELEEGLMVAAVDGLVPAAPLVQPATARRAAAAKGEAAVNRFRIFMEITS